MNFEIQARPGEIVFNLEELKDNLTKEVEIYNNYVVTEETVKEDKKDLARLRKARKELNDRKIAVKETFMTPYTAFEEEVKEALAILDKPIDHIDKQVKDIEAAQKEEKKKHAREIYADVVGEYAEYLPFEKVFNEKWLNASTGDKDIIDDCQVGLISTKSNLDAIKALNSEIEDKLLDVYKTDGLSAAIQKNTDYLDTKRRAEENLKPVQKPFMNEPEFVIKVTGSENIDRLKEFLDFSGIDYEVV